MRLITQSVDTANVRRDTLNGREHIVAPTVAVKPSDELHGGYVPSSEFQKAASDWNGRPITLGHPTNPRGQLISANDPSVVENVALGGFYNAVYEPSDDSTRGELWLDIQKARDMGGAAEQALEMLENGEPLEVSTGYRAQPGEPGEYDGEYRQNVQVDIHPDHVAVLPNSTGRCSWDDGCGAPRVNADADADPSAADADPATVVEDYADASLADDLTLHADAEADDSGSAQNMQNEPPNQNADVDQNAAVRALHRFANAMGVPMDADTDTDPDDTPNGDPGSESEDDGPDGDGDDGHDDKASANNDPDGDGGGNGNCDCGADDHSHDQKGNCDCQTDDSDQSVLGNQQEGDRVRWDSDSGTSREPDDVRYGIVVDLLQDGPADEVKVAVYAPDSDEGEWTATGSDVNVSTDNLNVIEQFPAIDQVNANKQNTNMSQNYDLETLIANSAFNADELRDDDELRTKVADTLSITGNDGDGDADADDDGDDQNQPDDDGSDDGDDDDADADDGADDTGAGADDDTIESLQATVETLASTVEEQNQKIEKIQANEKQEREERRETLKSRIQANSSTFSDEQLDEASDDLLESIANDVAGGMADLSARSPTSIPAQRSNSSDADDYPAGTMAEYKEKMAANEGGD